MKPPKPRITKRRLTWKWEGQWTPYHRTTWTDGGKRRERAVKLKWEGDPQKLDDLYWACEAGQHERQQTPDKYTWRELIEAWRADPRVQRKLSESTKRSYRREMDAVMEKNGGKDVRKTTRAGMRAAHDKLAETPRKADWRVQIVRRLWNYAKTDLDWPLGDNPASGIELFGPQRPYEPWPAWLVRKLEDAPETVRTTAELILGTGQRPGAAIAMRHDQFRGEWMQVHDEKQDEMFDTFCPHPLRDYLATAPKRGAHVLAKSLTEPLGYDAVEKAFRDWRDGLGDKARPFVLHGLRKLAIVRLAEAGCSDAEIQAVTGQSAEMVAYYRAKANRKLLSRNAHERSRNES